jgi:hypothetical protein
MQTSIAIDKATRDRAAKRAQAEHMPLAVVVRIFLNDYADGKLSIGAHATPSMPAEVMSVDAATQKKMDAVLMQWRDSMKK